jgi:hypothetical protein
LSQSFEAISSIAINYLSSKKSYDGMSLSDPQKISIDSAFPANWLIVTFNAGMANHCGQLA